MICLVALHVSWNFIPCCTPRLVILHISCYSTSHKNEGFYRKFLNFTSEYLRVTMCGLPCVSEVTLELYRSYLATKLLATHSTGSINYCLHLFMQTQFQLDSYIYACTNETHSLANLQDLIPTLAAIIIGNTN